MMDELSVYKAVALARRLLAEGHPLDRAAKAGAGAYGVSVEIVEKCAAEAHAAKIEALIEMQEGE